MNRTRLISATLEKVKGYSGLYYRSEIYSIYGLIPVRLEYNFTYRDGYQVIGNITVTQLDGATDRSKYLYSLPSRRAIENFIYDLLPNSQKEA